MINGSDHNVEVAIGVEDGKVITKWPMPITQIVFDPQNAYRIGEALARAAHEAQHGVSVQTDESYIAEQVRSRLTEERRSLCINRVARMMTGETFRTWSPGKQALEIVDAILREVL